MYPGGLWDTPRPGAHFCGRWTTLVALVPTVCNVFLLSPDASMMEANKVLLEQQTAT